MPSDPAALTDDAFLNAFLTCRLPPGAFNHRNHLRVAWLHLRRFPLEEAIERTCAGIAQYAAHLGATDRYHRTLTEALIRLMAHAGASDTSLSFEDSSRRHSGPYPGRLSCTG